MEQVITGKKTTAEVGVEALAIYEVLKTAEVGQVIDYATLSSAAGRNVQAECAGSLATARRMCQREHLMVFGVVRGLGLRRLSNAQIVESSASDIHKIERVAKRGIKRLTCADYSALNDEQRPVFNARVAVLGTLAQHSKPSQLTQIEKTYANENRPVLPGNMKVQA